jgi:hypothetical protein
MEIDAGELFRHDVEEARLGEAVDLGVDAEYTQFCHLIQSIPTARYTSLLPTGTKCPATVSPKGCAASSTPKACGNIDGKVTAY